MPGSIPMIFFALIELTNLKRQIKYNYYMKLVRSHLLKAFDVRLLKHLSMQKSMVRIVGVVLATIMTLYIYKVLLIDNDINSLVQEMQSEWQTNNPALMVIACLLVAPNWFLESAKLRIGMNYSIDFLSAFKSVMVGVSLGIFTPARLGEYAGRVINVDSNLKIIAVKATLLSSLAQSSVTVMAGVLSIVILSKHQYLSFTSGMTDLIFWGSLFMLICLLASFFFLDKMWPTLWRIKFFEKTFKAYHSLALVERIMLLLTSALRYSVYLVQYFLLSLIHI